MVPQGLSYFAGACHGKGHLPFHDFPVPVRPYGDQLRKKVAQFFCPCSAGLVLPFRHQLWKKRAQHHHPGCKEDVRSCIGQSWKRWLQVPQSGFLVHGHTWRDQLENRGHSFLTWLSRAWLALGRPAVKEGCTTSLS